MKKLIHIDPFSINLSRTPTARLRIQAQISPLFQELLANLDAHTLKPKHPKKADHGYKPVAWHS